MGRTLRGFVADETGQDMIEYALLASLLSIASIAALKLLGSKIGVAFASINKNL